MTSSFSLPFIERLWQPALAIALFVGALAVATPSHAAFPGTPGPIAYSKAISTELDGTSGGLFARGPRRLDGAQRLTADPYDTAPSYSANSRLVAFARVDIFGQPGTSQIHVMNADGSGLRALTRGDSYDSNPSFSPNGRQVVFDRSVGVARIPQIFIVNVDGTGLRQLTTAGDNYDPVFAPNGRWIAFVSSRDRDFRPGRADIYSMRPDGSRQRILVGGPRKESEPDISPDGRRIAFTRGSPRGPNIFVAKSSGRRVRALTHFDDDCFRTVCHLSPAWAPDGKHLAFIHDSRYSADLEVMRSDGTNVKGFASGTLEVEGYGTTLSTPAWGPKPR